MTTHLTSLSVLPADRSSLREQAARTLRDLIVSGQIQPGARITERDVADLLGTSRMPARDALLDLERQGLVASRPAGRFVIQLSEPDVVHLYDIRLALEKLALAEALPAARIEAGRLELNACLTRVRSAVEQKDPAAYTSSDLALHEAIWRLAGNPYLDDLLHSLIGPIFMLISRQSRYEEDWSASLDLHSRLVSALCGGRLADATQVMNDHMQLSLTLARKGFN